MTSLTIRNLDPAVKQRLRARAARHGRSMQEEARRILAESCGPAPQPETLADIAGRLFGAENGVELELPPRSRGTGGFAGPDNPLAGSREE